jgi:flagellar biosynthesis component FlhA
MEAVSFLFFFKIKDTAYSRRDVDENAPIICSKKNRYVVKKRFEKYCGSILVLSILDVETSSV